MDFEGIDGKKFNEELLAFLENNDPRTPEFIIISDASSDEMEELPNISVPEEESNHGKWLQEYSFNEDFNTSQSKLMTNQNNNSKYSEMHTIYKRRPKRSKLQPQRKQSEAFTSALQQLDLCLKNMEEKNSPTSPLLQLLEQHAMHLESKLKKLVISPYSSPLCNENCKLCEAIRINLQDVKIGGHTISLSPNSKVKHESKTTISGLQNRGRNLREASKIEMGRKPEFLHSNTTEIRILTLLKQIKQYLTYLQKQERQSPILSQLMEQHLTLFEKELNSAKESSPDILIDECEIKESKEIDISGSQTTKTENSETKTLLQPQKNSFEILKYSREHVTMEKTKQKSRNQNVSSNNLETPFQSRNKLDVTPLTTQLITQYIDIINSHTVYELQRFEKGTHTDKSKENSSRTLEFIQKQTSAASRLINGTLEMIPSTEILDKSLHLANENPTISFPSTSLDASKQFTVHQSSSQLESNRNHFQNNTSLKPPGESILASSSPKFDSEQCGIPSKDFFDERNLSYQFAGLTTQNQNSVPLKKGNEDLNALEQTCFSNVSQNVELKNSLSKPNEYIGNTFSSSYSFSPTTFTSNKFNQSTYNPFESLNPGLSTSSPMHIDDTSKKQQITAFPNPQITTNTTINENNSNINQCFQPYDTPYTPVLQEKEDDKTLQPCMYNRNSASLNSGHVPVINLPFQVPHQSTNFVSREREKNGNFSECIESHISSRSNVSHVPYYANFQSNYREKWVKNSADTTDPNYKNYYDSRSSNNLEYPNNPTNENSSQLYPQNVHYPNVSSQYLNSWHQAAYEKQTFANHNKTFDASPQVNSQVGATEFNLQGKGTFPQKAASEVNHNSKYRSFNNIYEPHSTPNISQTTKDTIRPSEFAFKNNENFAHELHQRYDNFMPNLTKDLKSLPPYPNNFYGDSEKIAHPNRNCSFDQSEPMYNTNNEANNRGNHPFQAIQTAQDIVNIADIKRNVYLRNSATPIENNLDNKPFSPFDGNASHTSNILKQNLYPNTSDSSKIIPNITPQESPMQSPMNFSNLEEIQQKRCNQINNCAITDVEELNSPSSVSTNRHSDVEQQRTFLQKSSDDPPYIVACKLEKDDNKDTRTISNDHLSGGFCLYPENTYSASGSMFHRKEFDDVNRSYEFHNSINSRTFPAKRRGRGRPKKQPSNNDNMASNNSIYNFLENASSGSSTIFQKEVSEVNHNSEFQKSGPLPVKRRGRGRPRKQSTTNEIGRNNSMYSLSANVSPGFGSIQRSGFGEMNHNINLQNSGNFPAKRRGRRIKKQAAGNEISRYNSNYSIPSGISLPWSCESSFNQRPASSFFPDDSYFNHRPVSSFAPGDSNFNKRPASSYLLSESNGGMRSTSSFLPSEPSFYTRPPHTQFLPFMTTNANTEMREHSSVVSEGNSCQESCCPCRYYQTPKKIRINEREPMDERTKNTIALFENQRCVQFLQEIERNDYPIQHRRLLRRLWEDALILNYYMNSGHHVSSTLKQQILKNNPHPSTIQKLPI